MSRSAPGKGEDSSCLKKRSKKLLLVWTYGNGERFVAGSWGKRLFASFSSAKDFLPKLFVRGPMTLIAHQAAVPA
jgi:hypothetical protein